MLSLKKKTPLEIGKQWVARKFENTLPFVSNSISTEKKKHKRISIFCILQLKKIYIFKYMIQIFPLTKFQRIKKYILKRERL